MSGATSRASYERRRLKFWTGVHAKRFQAHEPPVKRTPEVPLAYLTIKEVAAIAPKAYCGQCHGTEDLMYHHNLEWLLCRRCRRNYYLALRELSTQAQLERAYAPAYARTLQGGYHDNDH